MTSSSVFLNWVSAARLKGSRSPDFCRAIAVIKEHLWEFLERQGFMNAARSNSTARWNCCACSTGFFDRGFVLCDRGLRAVQPVAGLIGRLMLSRP